MKNYCTVYLVFLLFQIHLFKKQKIFSVCFLLKKAVINIFLGRFRARTQVFPVPMRFLYFEAQACNAEATPA